MQPYYEQDGITIFHARCEDVLPTLGAASIDAVITDPPYGTTACAWDTPIPFDFMWRELKRVTKRNAAIVLFGSQPFTSALVMSNPKLFRYEWVWEKDKASGYLDANRKPLKAHESIVVFGAELPIYHPQKTIGHSPSNKSSVTKQAGSVYRLYEMKQGGGNTDRYPRSVQRFNTVNSAHDPVHPTQKPLALLEYLILTYTNPGDTVLDFTCGSGTTPVAAKKLGRKCIAIEQELEYVEIAATRLYQGVFDLQGV